MWVQVKSVRNLVFLPDPSQSAASGAVASSPQPAASSAAAVAMAAASDSSRIWSIIDTLGALAVHICADSSMPAVTDVLDDTPVSAFVVAVVDLVEPVLLERLTSSQHPVVIQRLVRMVVG